MVSDERLRNERSAIRSQDRLASYIGRHPNLREDFILITRQHVAGAVTVITVGDIVGDGSNGTTTSDVSLRH
jgi:hypothetical protein